jgi:hypothetical protein
MKESVIQKQIIDYLQLLENQWQLYFFRSWSGLVKTANGNMFKTGKPWCPDLSVVIDGQYIGLEVKTQTWKQSKSQKIAQELIENTWGLYYIVKSVEDVIWVFEECLECV